MTGPHGSAVAEQTSDAVLFLGPFLFVVLVSSALACSSLLRCFAICCLSLAVSSVCLVHAVMKSSIDGMSRVHNSCKNVLAFVECLY